MVLVVKRAVVLYTHDDKVLVNQGSYALERTPDERHSKADPWLTIQGTGVGAREHWMLQDRSNQERGSDFIVDLTLSLSHNWTWAITSLDPAEVHRAEVINKVVEVVT